MNRGELRTYLSTVLNFNSSSTDADFSTTQLNQAIQLAYNRCVVDAQQHGTRKFFLKTVQFTWPSGQLQYQLTNTASNTSTISIRDVTDAEGGPGYPVDLWWKEHNVLQWATTDGPSENRTIELHFLASAEDLLSDGTVPLLVPLQFHELIIWEAAIWLREVADETAPGAWVGNRTTWQQRYWKHVSSGRPMEDAPTVGMSQGLISGQANDIGTILAQDGTSLGPA